MTDITEIPCKEGKLYLASILDCYDGSIRSFKMDDNMRAEICVETYEIQQAQFELYAKLAEEEIVNGDVGVEFSSFSKEMRNNIQGRR